MTVQKGFRLYDGTILSPREKEIIKERFKQKRIPQSQLCEMYDITLSDMNKVVGSISNVYGSRV